MTRIPKKVDIPKTRKGYEPCGCYIGTNGAVIVRCDKHGATQLGTVRGIGS